MSPPRTRLHGSSSNSNNNSSSCATIQPVQAMEKDHENFIDEMRQGSNNIMVVVRSRPLSLKEAQKSSYETVKVLDERVAVLLDPGFELHPDDVLRKNRNKEMQFAFDHVFDKSAGQEHIYRKSVEFLISGIFEGFNGTVFAYGATGAGKTYTMIGNSENPGIMERAMNDVFRNHEQASTTKEIAIRASYIEIYNETIKDLLSTSAKHLELREDPSQGVVVSGITEISVATTSEILHLLKVGNKNRSIESTGANEVSSRSHAVLQIMMQIKDRATGISSEISYSKLSLVDLAGSERASATQNRGIRLIEGAKINQSLLVLGNCIKALSEASEKNTKNQFVQYRGSKLTRLLKDSLGGNCRTVMIANVSPHASSFEDTYNTLNFANRAKNIKTHVTRNYLSVDNHIANYTNLIDALKKENENLKRLLRNQSSVDTREISGIDGFTNGDECRRISETVDLRDQSVRHSLQLQHHSHYRNASERLISPIKTRKHSLFAQGGVVSAGHEPIYSDSAVSNKHILRTNEHSHRGSLSLNCRSSITNNKVEIFLSPFCSAFVRSFVNTSFNSNNNNQLSDIFGSFRIPQQDILQAHQQSQEKQNQSTSKAAVKTNGVNVKERQISYLRNQLRLRNDIFKDKKGSIDVRNSSNSVVAINHSYDGGGDDDFLAHPSYSNSRMSDCPSVVQSDILNLSPNLDDVRDFRRVSAAAAAAAAAALAPTHSVTEKITKSRAKSKNSSAQNTSINQSNNQSQQFQLQVTHSEESEQDAFRLPHLALSTSPTQILKAPNSMSKAQYGSQNSNPLPPNNNNNNMNSEKSQMFSNYIAPRSNLPQQNKTAIQNNINMNNHNSESEKNSSAAPPIAQKEEHSTNRTTTRSPSKRELCETSFDNLDKRARIQKLRAGSYSCNSNDSTTTPSTRYNSTHAYEPKSQTTTNTTVTSHLASAAATATATMNSNRAPLQQIHINESEPPFHTSSGSVLSNRSYQRRQVKPIHYNQSTQQQQQNHHQQQQVQQQQQQQNPSNQSQNQFNISQNQNNDSRIQMYLNKELYTVSQDQYGSASNLETNNGFAAAASATASSISTIVAAIPAIPTTVVAPVAAVESQKQQSKTPRILEIPPLSHLPSIGTMIPESVSSSASTQWSAKARNKIKHFVSESSDHTIAPNTTVTASPQPNILMHDRYGDRNHLQIRASIGGGETQTAQKHAKFEERKATQQLMSSQQYVHSNSLRKQHNLRDDSEEHGPFNRFAKVRQSFEESRSSRDARNDRLKQLNLNIRNLKHHDIKVTSDIPSSTMSIQQHRNALSYQQQENIPMQQQQLHSNHLTSHGQQGITAAQTGMTALNQRERANNLQVRRSCASQNQNPIQFKRPIDHRSERSISAKITSASRIHSGTGGLLPMKF